jgi:hypothetical protein
MLSVRRIEWLDQSNKNANQNIAYESKYGSRNHTYFVLSKQYPLTLHAEDPHTKVHVPQAPVFINHDIK